MLASPRAKAMFTGSWTEAALVHPDGYRHWKICAPLDKEAFTIVMHGIHGLTGLMPRTVDLELFSFIATVVDDLGCCQTFSFIANSWLGHLTKPTAAKACRNLESWLRISYVFRESDILHLVIRNAIRFGKRDIDLALLPIPSFVQSRAACTNCYRHHCFWLTLPLDGINQKRKELLQQLYDGLSVSYSRLLKGTSHVCPCQSDECRSAAVGALKLHFDKWRLLPLKRNYPPGRSINLLMDCLDTLKPLIRYSSTMATVADRNECWSHMGDARKLENDAEEHLYKHRCDPGDELFSKLYNKIQIDIEDFDLATLLDDFIWTMSEFRDENMML